MIPRPAALTRSHTGEIGMPEDEIEKIEDELQRARDDLSESFHQINVKVEEQLDVSTWVRNRPLLAVGCAGALGFVVGLSSKATLPTVAALLGAAIGFSLDRTGGRN
jgi:hypothetical protein